MVTSRRFVARCTLSWSTFWGLDMADLVGLFTGEWMLDRNVETV